MAQLSQHFLAHEDPRRLSYQGADEHSVFMWLVTYVFDLPEAAILLLGGTFHELSSFM
jgi:hypothetical protein